MLFVFLVFSMRHTQCTQHLPLKCCFCCCCKFKWIQISNAWILQHTAHSTHDSFSENDKFWHLCFGCHFLKYWHFFANFPTFHQFSSHFLHFTENSIKKNATPKFNWSTTINLHKVRIEPYMPLAWCFMDNGARNFSFIFISFFVWCVSILCECACVYPNDK